MDYCCVYLEIIPQFQSTIVWYVNFIQYAVQILVGYLNSIYWLNFEISSKFETASGL